MPAGGWRAGLRGGAADSGANWVAAWWAWGVGMDADIYSLAIVDDDNGTSLYAGGIFTLADGIAAANMAEWRGTGWNAMGSGTDSWVAALQATTDENGPELFAGGN